MSISLQALTELPDPAVVHPQWAHPPSHIHQLSQPKNLPTCGFWGLSATTRSRADRSVGRVRSRNTSLQRHVGKPITTQS